MHFAVVKINLYIHHAVTGKNTLGAGLLRALLDGRHERAVHVLSDERIGELQSRVARFGFDAHPDFGKLARAAGLLFMAVF